MSEMIDRVALALSQSFRDAIVAGRGMKFEETKVDLPPTEIWARYAKAAIEAMRMPTGPMLEVYSDLNADEWLDVDPAMVWDEMIDEALK